MDFLSSNDLRHLIRILKKYFFSLRLLLLTIWSHYGCLLIDIYHQVEIKLVLTEGKLFLQLMKARYIS